MFFKVCSIIRRQTKRKIKTSTPSQVYRLFVISNIKFTIEGDFSTLILVNSISFIKGGFTFGIHIADLACSLFHFGEIKFSIFNHSCRIYRKQTLDQTTRRLGTLRIKSSLRFRSSSQLGCIHDMDDLLCLMDNHPHILNPT